MDIEKWRNHEWKSLDDFWEFREEAVVDLGQRIEEAGFKVIKSVPNLWRIDLVVGSFDGKKFICVSLDDVRETCDWPENVKFRRMSSERDWRGSKSHFEKWDDIGRALNEYMKDKYDDEVI